MRLCNYHLVENLANVDEVETNKQSFSTLRERILSFKASALSLNQPLWREKNRNQNCLYWSSTCILKGI